MPAVKRTYGSVCTTRPHPHLSRRFSYSPDPLEPKDEDHASPSRYPTLQPALSLKRKREIRASAGGAENAQLNLLPFLAPKRSERTGGPLAKKRLRSKSLQRGSTSVSNALTLPSPSSVVTVNSPQSKKSTTMLTPLRQLHLTLGQTAIRTCSTCQLSYTLGAPEDEYLHKKHCARISRGAEWGKEESRYEGNEVTVVESGISVQGMKGGVGEKGRIVRFSASAGGKLKTKLAIILQTVNHALSAPELDPEILNDSKAYLFLVSSSSHPSREKIVGCVIAQRIQTAMKIIPSTYLEHLSYSSPPQSSNVTPDASSLEDVVVVHYSDSLESSTSSLSNDTGLFCSSTPLPTPLGIPRLFVSSSYRRRGIALHLLNCAAKTFIHGCPLDPKKGQIAFSQPSRAGRGVLEKWAGGNGRVYEE